MSCLVRWSGQNQGSFGVAGASWVSTKRKGGPGSISGCKALQGVAESCYGGLWYLGSKNNSTGVLGALWCVGGCLAVRGGAGGMSVCLLWLQVGGGQQPARGITRDQLQLVRQAVQLRAQCVPLAFDFLDLTSNFIDLHINLLQQILVFLVCAIPAWRCFILFRRS